MSYPKNISISNMDLTNWSLQIGHEAAKRLAPNASGCQDDYLPCLIKKLCLKKHITVATYNCILCQLQYCHVIIHI